MALNRVADGERNIQRACLTGCFQTDEKLYFRTSNSYIYSSAANNLNLVATTLGVTGATTFTGTTTFIGTIGVSLGNCPTGIYMGDIGATGEHIIDVIDNYQGMFVETGTYESAVNKGIELSDNNTRPVSFLFDDGGNSLTGNNRAVLSRVYLSATQGNGETIVPIQGQLKTANTKNLGPGRYAALDAYLEFAGDTTIQSGGEVCGVDIRVEAITSKTLTVASGGTLYGIRVATVGAGTLTSTGVSYGISVEDNGTITGDWSRGLNVDNCTIGVYVDDCPTGIYVGNAGATGEHVIDMVDNYQGMVIETGTYSSAVNKGIELSDNNVRPVSFLFDDGGNSLTGNNRAVLSRVYLSATQGNGETIVPIQGQLKTADAKNLGPGRYAALDAYLEFAGDTTVASGGELSALDIRVEAITSKTLTIASGGALYGIRVATVGAGTLTSTGTSAGIWIGDNGTITGDWKIGIDINNSTTGIDIGDNTTGINMGTSSGSGIVIAGSLMGVDLTTTMTGSSAVNGNEFNVTDSTTGSSGYARGIWLNMSAGGAKTGTAETNGVGIDLTVTGNSPFARALTLYTNATGTPTIGTMNAMDIYMDDEAAGVTQTGKRAINIGIDHGNDKGTCDVMVIRCHGGTIDNVFKFTDTTGSPYTNFISIDGACGFVGSGDKTGGAKTYHLVCDVAGAAKYIQLYDA